MSPVRRILASSICLLALALAPNALATAPAAKMTPDGYSYEFIDDDLLGSAQSAPSLTIKGPRRALRTLLIRPRVHFVAEMLKSVETL